MHLSTAREEARGQREHLRTDVPASDVSTHPRKPSLPRTQVWRLRLEQEGREGPVSGSPSLVFLTPSPARETECLVFTLSAGQWSVKETGMGSGIARIPPEPLLCPPLSGAQQNNGGSRELPPAPLPGPRERQPTIRELSVAVG